MEIGCQYRGEWVKVEGYISKFVCLHRVSTRSSICLFFHPLVRFCKEFCVVLCIRLFAYIGRRRNFYLLDLPKQFQWSGLIGSNFDKSCYLSLSNGQYIIDEAFIISSPFSCSGVSKFQLVDVAYNFVRLAARYDWVTLYTSQFRSFINIAVSIAGN